MWFTLLQLRFNIYLLFVTKCSLWFNWSKHNRPPEEILAQFGLIFPPVANISLNIPIQFLQASKIHLLWKVCLTLPRHQNGNNNINDPTNEYRSCTCISILLLKMKLGDFKSGPDSCSSGFPNASSGRGSPRSTLWNTRLSCLLILEERYSQSCASSCASKPFRGRLLCTDSHYWYTSHIHPPTRSTAATSPKAPTRTHFHRQWRTCRRTLHLLNKVFNVQCIQPNLCSHWTHSAKLKWVQYHVEQKKCHKNQCISPYIQIEWSHAL